MKNLLQAWAPHTLLFGIALVVVLGSAATPTAQERRSQPSAPLGPDPGRTTTQIAGVPAPEQMRAVYEDSPFVVPANSIFVVTGIGRSKTSPPDYRIDVVFDGTAMLKASFSYNAHGANGMLANVPPGLAASAGTVVEAKSTNNAGGVIFGYVAP